MTLERKVIRIHACSTSRDTPAGAFAIPAGGNRGEQGGVVMSLMGKIALVSLLAVVVAAIGVAGLLGLARALSRLSPSGLGSAATDAEWQFRHRNAHGSDGIGAAPSGFEVEEEGPPR